MVHFDKLSLKKVARVMVMKKKKSSGNFVLVIAIAIIIVLLFVIWNMQTNYLGGEPEEEEEVSYVDLEDLGVKSEDEEETVVEVLEEEEEEPVEPIVELEQVEVEVEEEVVVEPISVEETETAHTVITVVEGDLVSFPNLQAVDPDGDPLEFTFSEPLDENAEWQTDVGDAGTYEVTISASDGEDTVTETITIVVEALNSPPTIEIKDSFTIKEGETVSLNPVVIDPDGDDVEVAYSGWMTSSSRKASFDDDGEHKVVITANDGVNTVTKEITIIVNNVNRKPTFLKIV